MELRKVQLTGGSSITVTLPKAWVERSKIRAGDVVGCTEQPDGSLAVVPHIQGEREPLRYEVEVEEAEPDYIFRKVVAAYLMGYDQIRIVSKRPMTTEARSAIRLAVRRIMGLEIVDEQTSSVTLQDFLDPREFHLERAVRRMGILTQAMQEDAINALTNPKRGNDGKQVDDRDDEVDRLFWLVNKQYHAVLRDANYASKLGVSASQGLNFLLAARLIERTADHADRIHREALQLPTTIADSLLQRIEKQARRAVELFQNALQLLFKKDARRANQIIDDAEKFQETQKKLLREATELGGDTVAHLVYIFESIGRTAAYAADVSEIAINHAVASHVSA